MFTSEEIPTWPSLSMSVEYVTKIDIQLE
jgi:hypothetical protein